MKAEGLRMIATLPLGCLPEVSMRILIPRETVHGERRVAMVPAVVGKFTGIGVEVFVESGAGEHAYAADADYTAAGARVIPSADLHHALEAADVVASVRPLEYNRARRVKAGAICLSFLSPGVDTDVVRATRDAEATAMSFDLVPRISRAQSMDALTSQSLVTGYRAALVAADLLPKFFPLFMTAAGTIQPARVLVLGAGVAGLQAIATAKRLGARVSAYDVRPASADEVRSMGGTFITLDLDTLEGAGGYAREMTEERSARQRELLTPHIADSDVVITTAAVPGRTAPLLVTADMVGHMKPGSVVVDLASESGGNVEGSVAGEVINSHGVRIWGGQDVASEMPVHASQLLAMNVFALLSPAINEGEIALDMDDEVYAGCVVVFNGEIRNEAAVTAVGRS